MSSTLCKSVGVIFPPGMLPDCCQTLWLNHWERACLVLKQQISSEYTGFTKCWFGSSLVVQWIILHVSTEGGVRLIPWSGKIPQTVAKNKKKMVWSLTKLISMNQERVVRAIHSWGWWGGDDKGSFAHFIHLESIRQTTSTALNVCACMLSHSVVSDSFQP